MNFYPRFVTVDDFKNFTGIDLRAALRSDDNVSNQAERFLLQTEDHLMAWIDKNTFRTLDYENLSPQQMDNFKKAILAQALYTYRNGAIALGLESGYDSERGIVIDADKLAQLEVCQSAINYLSNAGLFNLNVKNRPRVMRGYPGLENLFPDGGGGPARNENQVYGFNPDAYVTLATAQNITGQKFFSQDLLLGDNIGLKVGTNGSNPHYLIFNDSSNESLAIGSNLGPITDDNFNLGTPAKRFKNLYISGAMMDGNSTFGLVLPDTTGWQANKTIATTDDIASNVTIVTTPGSESISDESATLHVMTTDTVQTVTAQKTFESNSPIFGHRKTVLHPGDIIVSLEQTTFTNKTTYYPERIQFSKNNNSNTTYDINFPEKSGTFALISDLPAISVEDFTIQ